MTQPPNVLFIMTDQQRFDTIRTGCEPPTPSMATISGEKTA